MIRSRFKRTSIWRFLSSLTVVILLVATAAPQPARSRAARRDRSAEEKHLFVWAGDQARSAPDFLAVIDFDEDSPNYGKVIRTVPIPPPGNVGNEPHHCHLVNDGRI